MNHFVRRVVVHPDFFEHDLLLFGNLARIEGRVQEHVGKNVDRQRNVTVDDFGVVAGRFFIGESVEIAADAVHRLGDGAGRSAFGTLEEHVLDEVRDAALFGTFRGRTDVGPNAERSGANGRHPFGQDADAVR